MHPRRDIAGDVVMNARRVPAQQRLRDRSRWQRLELDLDVGECVLGDVAAFREHDRQRFTDVADLVFGEWHLGALVEHEAGDRRRRNKQWPRPPVIAEIARGVDRDHPGAPARRRNVRPALDARVRH